MTSHATLQQRHAELLEALDQAVTLYRQDVDGAGRWGVAAAVVAVVKFLVAPDEGESPEAQVRNAERTAPLVALIAAFHDLYSGIPAPMLKGVNAGNAPATGALDRAGRSQAASAMQCLMMCGLSREKAARTVAKAIEGRPYAEGHQRELWKVVARWRDDLRAPRAHPGDYDVALYRSTLRQCDKMAKLPDAHRRLRAFANHLLNEKFVSAGRPSAKHLALRWGRAG